MAIFKKMLNIFRSKKSSDRPELISLKGGQEQVELVKVDQAFCVKGNRKLVRRQLGCRGSLIVSISGLGKDYGIITLLKAFHLLVNKKGSSNILLLITHCEAENMQPDMSFPKDPEVLKLLEGLENRVKFFGPQSKERLATLFSAATVTVVPYQKEQTLLEAQACGSPVITDQRVEPNLVLDGETGLLVTDDPEDLALAMEAIIINEVMAKRMGKKAAIRMKLLAGQAVST